MSKSTIQYRGIPSETLDEGTRVLDVRSKIIF